MRQLAQFLQALGRRFRARRETIRHFFRNAKFANKSPFFIEIEMRFERDWNRRRCGAAKVRFGGPMSWPASARSIATFSLLPKKVEKQLDGFLFPPEMMDHHLSLGSNAAPSAKQTNVSEQTGFNRHGIIARHVP